VVEKEQATFRSKFQRNILNELSRMLKNCIKHYSIDIKTGKKVSFGVVRVSEYFAMCRAHSIFIECRMVTKIAPRVMAYHSRQVLLLRSKQERHLDQVLKRKEKVGEQPKAFLEKIVIRQHLDSTERTCCFYLGCNACRGSWSRS
jgi:CRISPR-associated endonuclease/helicase Cas3